MNRPLRFRNRIRIISYSVSCDPPRFLHVQGHLVNKLVGGVESFNVSQSGQEVNLNRPAVEVAVVVQEERLDLLFRFVKGRVAAQAHRGRVRAAVDPGPAGVDPFAGQKGVDAADIGGRDSRACFRGPGHGSPSRECGRAG